MSESNKSAETTGGQASSATAAAAGAPAQVGYETQQQRWVKYGANVALVAVIVVVLAVLVTWIAQRYSGRLDTTAAGTYSLKPQTLNVIKANEKPVKLISLYAPLSDKDRNKAGTDEASEKAELDAPRRVADLLEEYERKGKNITFETIDPDDAKRVDALYDEVTAKYGGAIASYKKFLDEFKASLEKINKMVSDEAARSASLPVDKLGKDNIGRILSSVFDTVAQIPENLTEIKTQIDKKVAEKRPDYNAIAESSADVMDQIAEQADAIAKFAVQLKALEAARRDAEGRRRHPAADQGLPGRKRAALRRDRQGSPRDRREEGQARRPQGGRASACAAQ
jgi:hypothetical protein